MTDTSVVSKVESITVQLNHVRNLTHIKGLVMRCGQSGQLLNIELTNTNSSIASYHFYQT